MDGKRRAQSRGARMAENGEVVFKESSEWTHLPDWASSGAVMLELLRARGQLTELGERLRVYREGGYLGLDVLVFFALAFSAEPQLPEHESPDPGSATLPEPDDDPPEDHAGDDAEGPAVATVVAAMTTVIGLTGEGDMAGESKATPPEAMSPEALSAEAARAEADALLAGLDWSALLADRPDWSWDEAESGLRCPAGALLESSGVELRTQQTEDYCSGSSGSHAPAPATRAPR